VRRITLALALGAVALGAIGACGAQRATAPSAQPLAASTDSATAEGALESADVSALTLSPVALLDQPVDAAHRAGDDAVYFVSRTGTIHRFVNNALSNEPVLDISDLTVGEGERGLLGLAFSPDGTIAYVNYTNRSGDTVVAALNVADNGAFERGSLRTIITIEQPFRNHNAGDLVVEPNGMLLVPMGDGGSADDPLRVSLDDSSLLGKVLRVDATTGATTIIAKGLRNPWRVDLFDDRLWLADVGQNKWEEVSVLDSVSSRTANNSVDFGWSAYEANDRFNDDQTSTSHTPPVVAYEHGENGCSVSGGAVAVSGALRGRYVFADYCSGRVWSTPADITSTTSSNSSFASLATLHFDAIDSPAAVVRAHNDVYVLSLSGNIWRING
jgi:glucose/arabinose dehydrogenase